ncbi:uncharacterized protein [Hetaerina americana]|uniref:uncharacterized protein isoform X2 n=1 Tax=Hetaerina americana TaxID=62018 RepID=UPI003A7F1B3C
MNNQWKVIMLFKTLTYLNNGTHWIESLLMTLSHLIGKEAIRVQCLGWIEQETTLKVKTMMDNIEKVLYGEAHEPVPRVVAEECQQWKMRFPHLRVVGKAVDINYMEILNNNHSYLEKGSPVQDGNSGHSCNNEDESNKVEEDQEETYASHGTIEHKPLLSHEFHHATEPIINSESRLMHEALLDELTKHVWKEVVELRVKEFLEKFSKKNQDENTQRSSNKQWLSGVDVTGRLKDLGKHDKDQSISPFDTQIQLPLSAGEIDHTMTVLSSNNEHFESHRRHSDQISLSYRKCKNRQAPCKISEESDEGEEVVMKNPEIYWNILEDEKGVIFNTRMPKINDFQGHTLKRATPQEERLQFDSPRCLKPTEVTEKLRLREKSGTSNSLNLRSGRKNESIKYSGKHYPQSKSRYVRLPAIQDHKWLTNNEASSSYMYGRSSSALPKLTPKTLRPTMSSYKNMHGERTAPRKHMSCKREISPVKDEMDVCYNKMNRSCKCSLVQSTIGGTILKAKQEKLKREKT